MKEQLSRQPLKGQGLCQNAQWICWLVETDTAITGAADWLQHPQRELAQQTKPRRILSSWLYRCQFLYNCYLGKLGSAVGSCHCARIPGRGSAFVALGSRWVTCKCSASHPRRSLLWEPQRGQAGTVRGGFQPGIQQVCQQKSVRGASIPLIQVLPIQVPQFWIRHFFPKEILLLCLRCLPGTSALHWWLFARFFSRFRMTALSLETHVLQYIQESTWFVGFSLWRDLLLF